MAIASCIQRQYKQQSMIQINNYYLHADFPVTPASVQIKAPKYHVFSKHSFGICYISSSSGVGVAACSNNQAADTTPDLPEAWLKLKALKHGGWLQFVRQCEVRWLQHSVSRF